MIRRLFFALLLALSLSPALGQSPPPVPALPDTERRTSYSISATTCICNVNFALYGDSTDYANWLEVYLNGVRVNSTDPTFGWTITSPTGSLATIPRPVTDGVLTFNSVQTGTIQIVGARRPRRVSQFAENRGVAARDLNQAVTDITATLREMWDKTNDMTGRGLFSQPGQTVGLLPLPTACQGKFLGFDATGLIPTCTAGGAGTGNVVGPGSSVNGHFAIFSGTTGALLADHVIQGSDLPTPGASSLGGAFSSTCSTSNWFNTLSTSGAFGCTQPAFSDLTGQATLAQLPTIGANTALCSIAGGTPIACSKTQVTTLINPATAALSGALPAFPNNTTTYFRGDGTYVTHNCAALTDSSVGCSAARGQLPGETSNGNAAAGDVGEFPNTIVLVGSAVVLTTGVDANVASLSLTAGDWDVSGSVWTNPAGSTTSTFHKAWITTTTGTAPTVPATGTSITSLWTSTPAGGGNVIPVNPTRIILSGTTTVFLGATVTFATSTMGAYGIIRARRMR